MPNTNELYERYLRVDFPELEAIARANVWNRQSSISADGRGARVVAVAVDPEFLDIFELPFVSGDPDTALASPDALLLTRAAALRLFGTEDVLGKTVSLGGNLIDATVTGVLGEDPRALAHGQLALGRDEVRHHGAVRAVRAAARGR